MSLIIDTDLDRTLSEVDTMVPRDRLGGECDLDTVGYCVEWILYLNVAWSAVVYCGLLWICPAFSVT